MIEITYRIDPNDRDLGPVPTTPQEARRLLEEGNRGFSALLDLSKTSDEVSRRVIRVSAADLGMTGDGSVLQHNPFALVVGCADARVPIELIFGQGVNDLFVLRVAGNVLGEEILGSIDYALQYLPSLRLIVVLGHTMCGAVTAAAGAFLDPAKYLGLSADHELRSIVNQLFPAVRLSYASMIRTWGDDAVRHDGFLPGLIETSAVVNAALMAASLRSEISSQGLEGVKTVFSLYDVRTLRVGVRGVSDDETLDIRLLDPPPDSDGFDRLSLDVAAGPVVSALMTSESASIR
ncbi:MAG: carbonic anhydrase [Thermomicrobiales bacterium]